MELKIEYLPIKALKPYEKNTRKHQKKDVDNIAKSIEKFGMNDPIGIWKDNIIVEGHGRLLACKQLGMTEVPCVRLDHLTDEQRREYAIAHNATAELSEWDFDILPEELAELDFSGFDFDFGIEDDEEEIEIVEDEVPEVDEDAEPITKLGDIWQLGRHRLMCGDSTDKATVELLMDCKKADMAFTSPPYGVNLDYNTYEDTFENTTNLIELVLPMLCKFTENYVVLNWGDIVSASKINGTEQPSQYAWLPKYLEIMSKENWYIWAERIWKKPHARCSGIWSASSNRPVSDWEYIFTWANKHPKYNERNNGSHFGIIDSTESTQSDTLKDHPGAFPVYVASKVVEIHTRKNENVLDLFGGTGTTLIACEQLDRTCYMMELDEKYCDVIIKRWENLTGKKAVLIND